MLWVCLAMRGAWCLCPFGYGSNLNHQKTACFGPWLHLPGNPIWGIPIFEPKPFLEGGKGERERSSWLTRCSTCPEIPWHPSDPGNVFWLDIFHLVKKMCLFSPVGLKGIYHYWKDVFFSSGDLSKRRTCKGTLHRETKQRATRGLGLPRKAVGRRLARVNFSHEPTRRAFNRNMVSQVPCCWEGISGCG